MERVENTAVSIEYHADDYGLFPAQSRRILDCLERGALNGISVMPNSPYLKRELEEFYKLKKDAVVTVHLNLMEGRSLCPREQVRLLTNADGVLRCGFSALLLHSLLPGRKAWKDQVKRELRAQIHAVAQLLPADTPLRLDGHAHYHMVPVVFDAMMEVLEEDRVPVEYIRIPREYPWIYLRVWGQLRDIAPVNFAKVGILNLLALRNCRKYRDRLASMERKLFLGVFLSGRMHLENVRAILPQARALARKKGWGIELLSHPGGVYEEADAAALTNRQDAAFLTSPLRRMEADMLMAMARK